MQIFTYSGLSRRGFLAVSAGAWLAVATRPLHAEGPTPVPALAFDGDDLLVASDRIRRYGLTDDVQKEWSAPGIIHALATHRNRPGLVVAGLDLGGVSISKDGGQNWEPSATGLARGPVDAIAIAAGNSDLFYAAVRGDGLWKSEDAGQSWTFAMDRPWQDGAEHDPLSLASVDLETGMGGIWVYAGTKAGLTRVPDCFCRWQDVQPGNAMDALVSGEAPPPKAPLPKGEAVRALASAPLAASTLYAALPSGLWMSADAGVVWSHLAQGSATAIAVHSEHAGPLAAFIDGNLKISRDGGENWAAVAAA